MYKHIFDIIIVGFLILSSNSLKLEQVSLSTNLIVNGNFELPAFTDASTRWKIFTKNDNTGWELSNNEIELGEGTIYNKNWKSGRVCELDANKNNKISQTLTLDEIKYVIEFDVASRTAKDTNSNLMNAYFNCEKIYEFVPQNYNIVHVKKIVTAKKGNNTLAFEGAGTSDSYGATIDNVKLYRFIEC